MRSHSTMCATSQRHISQRSVFSASLVACGAGEHWLTKDNRRGCREPALLPRSGPRQCQLRCATSREIIAIRRELPAIWTSGVFPVSAILTFCLHGLDKLLTGEGFRKKSASLDK